MALRYPIKKWAAAAALAAAFFYLLLAGAPIPTQRAFLMIGLVLLAVMVDRIGISMRLVAWAAIAVLAIAPDAVLGASFQMSFAAVVALVAVYEALRARFAVWRGGWMWWQRPLLYFVGVALTTVVATAATLPFAVDHFNRLAVYGLAANLAAVPITAFWVMPWGLVALLLLPAGLESWALQPMAWGLTAIIEVAETIAGWDGAVRHVLAPGALAMAAIVTGGLWLSLWQRRWRLLGLIPLVLGAGATALERPPDILANADARMIAVRDNDGRWLFNETRREGFVRDGWLRLVAAEDWAGWPETGLSASGGVSCDSLGCAYRRGGYVAALVVDARAFGEDCHGADLVVAMLPAPDFCRDAAGAVIDLFDLLDRGAHAVWLEDGGLRIESVGETRGDRPWVTGR